MPFEAFDMEYEDRPPLWNALLGGHLMDAEELLKTGAKLDDVIEADGNTFLHRAAQKGDMEVVHFFLKHGCPRSLESFDSCSYTPLMRAAAKGKEEVVDYLLWKGADPNACEEARIGDTALIMAVRNAHAGVVKLLIEAGADPWIRGWMQASAHDHAGRIIGTIASYATSQKIQELLAGARPRAGKSGN